MSDASKQVLSREKKNLANVLNESDSEPIEGMRVWADSTCKKRVPDSKHLLDGELAKKEQPQPPQQVKWGHHAAFLEHSVRFRVDGFLTRTASAIAKKEKNEQGQYEGKLHRDAN